MSAPAYAITLQQAHTRFDHLIGTQNNPVINNIINDFCSKMVDQTGAASDDVIFMDSFGDFLYRMFFIAQSPSQERPDIIARGLTELMKSAHAMRTVTNNWNDINPLDSNLKGAFAWCIPTEDLQLAFAQANTQYPLTGRSPLSFLANTAQLLAYIKLARSLVHQADQGLGLLEKFLENPTSLLNLLSSLSQAK